MPDYPSVELCTINGTIYYGSPDCLYVPADAFELEPSGQLSIGVDGEQRAIPGLAPAGKPAPLTFERDAAEKDARDEMVRLPLNVEVACRTPKNHPDRFGPARRCTQCQKPMNPAEWILGPVCGGCCRANHRAAIGA